VKKSIGILDFIGEKLAYPAESRNVCIKIQHWTLKCVRVTALRQCSFI